MDYIISNLAAIFAATFVGLMIGVLFSALRTAGAGDAPRTGTVLLLIALVSEFWLAAILAGALIVAPVPANAWTIAMVTPIVIWIGFVVPVLATSYAFRALKTSLLLLDGLHWLVVMTAQAAVLHLIGLTKP